MTSVPATSAEATALRPLGSRARSRTLQRAVEQVIRSALIVCASISIGTTVAIVVVLAGQTWHFFAFETPVLRRITVEGESIGVTVRAVPAGEGWIVQPIAVVAESVDFASAGVKPGDWARFFSGVGDEPFASAQVESVESGRLFLAGPPQLTGAEEARLEVWRDEATASEFLTGTTWSPLLGSEKHFGIWPLVTGTLMVTLIAMIVAIPLGLMTAIYLSEYAHRRVRAVLKPVLEILAGVPTVIYGFFALTVITPFLQSFISGIDVYNVLSAGVAVGIMCLPIVSSLSEDALQAVPRHLREAAYAVGGTQFDVSVKVVVPAALSGVIAASLLAIARAVGETMIVTLAAGNLARMVLDPREQGQTMTAYMVQIFLGDTSNFGVEYYSSYAVAASLFVLTFIVTLIGHQIRVRFREEYH